MTGLVVDDRFLQHETMRGHPERIERYEAISSAVVERRLRDRCNLIDPLPANMALLLENHSDEYLERLQSACAGGKSFVDVPDCSICPESMETAILAAGAVVAATDEVMNGNVDNAFCAIRPPGHHAERDRAMGFCLLNNVAIAARHLISKHELQRILICDFDVHHGNGTQHSFEEDDRVLYLSVHGHPLTLYPGTGFETEQGRGRGKGFTMNVPLPPGSKDEDYRRAFEEVLLPRATEFAPQFVLVSAGFDAHRADPIGNQNLETESYVWMTDLLCELARTHSGGRLLSVLEGGYNLTALAEGVCAHLECLLKARSGS